MTAKEVGRIESASTFSPRTPWRADFPAVVVHSTTRIRDAHPTYAAAKAGDPDAGLRLALDLLQPDAVGLLQRIIGERSPIFLPVTAIETLGFNAIPDGMTQVLCTSLGWPRDDNHIVQNNKVGHTRAKAFNRIMTPAAFEGSVEQGGEYVLVDDHVGLGGTLANLKGHIETNGGRVIAMTVLTESRDASHIALRPATLAMIWEKHGEDLEDLWQRRLGHGVGCLTEIEGQLLCREPTVDAIRDRLAQGAIEARDRGLGSAVR